VLIGQTHNRTEFRHPLTRSVRDIRCRQFVLQKSGPKFIKIGDDPLRTNTPHHVKFHRARPTSYEKNVTKIVYNLQYFGVPGGPPEPKLTNIGPDVQQDPLLTCQISSRSENPFARYLLPNFVHFVDKQVHRRTTDACRRIVSPKPNQSSPNLGSMWPLARPLNVPNFVALHQTMYEKSVTKCFIPETILAL